LSKFRAPAARRFYWQLFVLADRAPQILRSQHQRTFAESTIANQQYPLNNSQSAIPSQQSPISNQPIANRAILNRAIHNPQSPISNVLLFD
jgi:hypothetical protein